ncbi:MAG TPA: hypothetical protein VHT29_04690 [Solirubrobacteraceae bacterium]|nr:hypothetical protein [Solirubrobacteraceae bacterium]
MKDETKADYMIKRMLTLAMLIASLASLGAASSALAKEPTKGFAVFNQCPRFTAEVSLCLYDQTSSGEVVLNKQKVPISSTITLQGGIIRNETTEEEKFVAAANGETLSKTPENVPGGLLGLVNCKEITGEGEWEKFLRGACESVFENGLTGVRAITELAKPASEIGINKNNLVNQEGVDLSLPVKIRLENPLLGSECYIGSSSHPIIWNLTTGTTSPPAPNKPITGKVGKISFTEEFEIVNITGNSSVNNSFSAPEVTGCGGWPLEYLLDPIIDAKIGLASEAGKNTAILTGNLQEASTESVIASE